MNKQKLELKLKELKLKEIELWSRYAENTAVSFEYRADAMHLVGVKLQELNE